jgi:hypothetical protein
MCNEKVIRRFAGTVILTSLALSQLVSPYWLLLTAFAGVNLIQSTFTNFCLAELIMGKLGLFGCRPGGETPA